MYLCLRSSHVEIPPRTQPIRIVEALLVELSSSKNNQINAIDTCLSREDDDNDKKRPARHFANKTFKKHYSRHRDHNRTSSPRDLAPPTILRTTEHKGVDVCRSIRARMAHGLYKHRAGQIKQSASSQQEACWYACPNSSFSKPKCLIPQRRLRSSRYTSHESTIHHTNYSMLHADSTSSHMSYFARHFHRSQTSAHPRAPSAVSRLHPNDHTHSRSRQLYGLTSMRKDKEPT